MGGDIHDGVFDRLGFRYNDSCSIGSQISFTQIVKAVCNALMEHLRPFLQVSGEQHLQSLLICDDDRWRCRTLQTTSFREEFGRL
jgi:hypothetical protein